MSKTKGVMLHGWGRVAPSACTLVDVDAETLGPAIKALPSRGGIARGLGRSYGDPAQNGGGHVLRLSSPHDDPRDDMIFGTTADGVTTATVGGGVSIDDLLKVIIPMGYFVPVTAGTRFVTIGGAIASDIHGKNHHREGSFGNHVHSIRLMLADTTVVEVSPQNRPDLFWATVGGMGLTGVIIDATFALLPIETSRISVETRRLGHLDDVMESMVSSDDEFRYSVAWLDLLASGQRFGRGVVTNGEHATLSELGPKAEDPLAYNARQMATMPPVIPPQGVINPLTVAAFNEMWYRKSPKFKQGELQSIPAYFHPLDGVAAWNRVYGRQGLVQYQFVVPHGQEGPMVSVLERLVAARVPTFLTVLKRFGPGNEAMMSFPLGGWTLAIDVPSATKDLGRLLRECDEIVLNAGGRHYLAKDYATSPESIRRGYPRLDEWRAIRDSVDPAGVWASDLSRRLQLTH